ncbi:hypothetical protein [Colwellia psychrerythraea]|uniref:Uncharacterized protein n=1 Tax=Colwellia psychrerythraea TaxID=28229 RepID=A0A099KEL0_COLPS|nr:hypothetical protein [Colwellia psychrerythraea]KGJ88457.1 hypothetical protein ND2E_3992 [Colwellia psychrerythraea]
MEYALQEVKTQAKKLLKALKSEPSLVIAMQIPLKKINIASPELLKLKHCLVLVSMELGFKDWHEAQLLLSGSNKQLIATNMGSFFYPKGCGGFINEWFADYTQARKILVNSATSKWLLPYKNQFIVVEKEYIEVFKLNKDLMSYWAEVKHDMVASYNSVAWDKIAGAVIRHRLRNY